ncbi:MAG: hypothetical protein IPP25_09410 [Saprospiraceae bacterium]|nr:hypothetical protein [Candidatus Opimibacter skivensis]
MSIQSILLVRKVNRYTFIALLLSLLTFVGVLFYNYFFKRLLHQMLNLHSTILICSIILCVIFILLVQAIFGP